MAELREEFLADRLTSRELLALLFVCECRRKRVIDTISFRGQAKPPTWDEFLARFIARLENLPEEERRYLIGSHLQSAEEVDIYSNEEIRNLLEQNRELINELVQELARNGCLK
ncbi:MAG: hypothetical protein AB1411_11590 [Nitrospirota bacterium]